MYDYRHRIYHPGLGRFIETDPLGQQIEGAKLSAEQTALYGDGAPKTFSSSELNLYRYCHNDPVDKSDPFGLLDILTEGYPATGPGGLAKVHEALSVMRTTEQGRMLLNSPGIMRVLPTGPDGNGVFHKLGVEGYKGNFRLYLDSTHPLFYDEHTYRTIYKHHPEEKAPETPEGRATVITHELGHGVLGLDDENKGGTNVRNNENVFRSQLKPPMDPRPSYGGTRVNPPKKKDEK
jgi:RHS repeat-associated protein